MSAPTSSIVPFSISSLPSRLTSVMVADKTTTTQSTGTTAAVLRLNRLQSASFDTKTPDVQVEEMGAQLRVGMLDELGEMSYKLEWADVGARNIANFLGVAFDPTAPGATFSAGLTEFQNASIDFIRLVADPKNNAFSTQYYQDCILDDFEVMGKNTGLVTNSVSGRGPNGVAAPGYFIPKIYAATSTDATNGYLSVDTILGSNEIPVEIYLPTAVAIPVGLAGTPTTGTGTLAAGTYPYRVAARNKVGSTLACTAVSVVLSLTGEIALSWTASSGATSYDVYRGGEFIKNVSTNSYTDNGSDTPNPAILPPGIGTTAVPSYWQQNGAQYFLKIEKLPGGSLTATPVRYYEANSPNGKTATYNSGTGHLTPSDPVVAGDVYRLVFFSYGCDSYPTTIPASSVDTLNFEDRAGVLGRTAPVTISAGEISRVTSLSIKFTLKRDHVQGMGENAIVYGVPAVPDVAISMTVKETDLEMLALLTTGSTELTSQGGTIASDWQDLNYLTRYGFATATPLVLKINDPFAVNSTLISYTCPQMAVTGPGYKSTQKADNEITLSAVETQGNLLLAATVPSS